ncbi:MAG: hypothetical protein ACYCZF_03190 [Anaerolineae bacterium]
MPLWLQVILALVVPIVWGLASAWLFDRISALRKKRGTKPCEPSEPHV